MKSNHTKHKKIKLILKLLTTSILHNPVFLKPLLTFTKNKIQFPYQKVPYLRDIREYINETQGHIFDVTSTQNSTKEKDPIKIIDDRKSIFLKNSSFITYANHEKNNFSRYEFGVVLSGKNCLYENYQLFNKSANCSEKRNLSNFEILDFNYGMINYRGPEKTDKDQDDYLISNFILTKNGSVIIEDMKKIPFKCNLR